MNAFCYHCHQPLAPQDNFPALVLGEQRQMCCPGCQAVANAIVDGGMEDYYRFRTESAEKANVDLEQVIEQISAFDDQAFQQEFVSQQGELSEVQLTVEGISCAACGWLIERQLSRINGISQIAVNVSARRATVKWHSQQTSLSAILRSVENIGYHALPFQPDTHEASYRKENKQFLKRLGLAGIMTMQLMMLAFGLYFGLFGDIEPQTQAYFHAISFILCAPVVGYSGQGFYRSAFNALRHKTVNMDVPISLAILGAFIASGWATMTEQGIVYFESVAMFIFLLLISRYLEHRSRHHAAEISANIIKHMPVSANLIKQNGTIQTCLAKQLLPGQTILVRAGEMVPIDGCVVVGHSQVDESMLSGEFEPVTKQHNDHVYGGTINHSGVLQVRVETDWSKALINQIVRLQEMALATKPRIALLADKVSRYFVVAVLVIALATYTFWTLQGNPQAFYITIAVLVATCPCALGLATPTALTCAIANLNRQGLLVKKADVLENLQHINTLAFDKTGTLTEGRFSLTKAVNFSSLADNTIQRIAASIEQHSEHPIASAFSPVDDVLACTDVQITQGGGLSATIEGINYRLGSARFVQYNIPEQHQVARVFLADQHQLLAAFYVDDVLRPQADSLFAQLRSQEFSNIETHLISGDNQTSVATLAKQLNIQHYHAACSPQQKYAVIQQLQQQGKNVLMVGDGINDSPVLAVADTSIAVGNASELAKNSADIVLLNNQLDLIAYLLKVARLANRKIRQNIGWAVGYNLLILPLAVSGLLTPWMAVAGMSLSSVIVVSNSLRILKYQGHKP
ncbi:heavy metal translocating P-type ATPase [Neptunicella sp. SCSIO 80796]|uniref:heavy metal translocating P-type ATPase n=1 Tax=Neptunicella plasticusilytica TaxID=3117012 RepID=UPI003A4D57B1